MYSLFLKEITGFFNTLTGYIVIILFILINSLFMWVFDGPMNLLDGGYATMDTLFVLAPWVFLMLIPAVTMKSFAEEKRSGTLDLLLTRPLTSMQIIGAKYFASMVLVIFALLPTLVYYFSVVKLGNPPGNLDVGGTWGSYLGLFFLAGAYAAIGLFCSSLTDNLIIAFLLSVFVSLLMGYGFEQAGTLFTEGKTGEMVLSLGIMDHYSAMSRGVIDTRDVVYFIALILVFVFLTRIRLKTPLLRSMRSISIVLLSAILLSSFYFRFDLTSEKRYTLSPFSKKTLQEISDTVDIQIYLDGDLNIPFQKMQQRIRETMDEFEVIAGDHLSYEFVNPFEGKDAKGINETVNNLSSKGLKASNILAKDKEGGTSEKLVFPGALIHFRGTEVPINLLKNNPRSSAEENINNSMQSLEFEFMRIISSLSADTIEKIAFLEGHGELNQYQVGDLTRELGWYFQVDRGMIGGKPGILNDYKAIIIAGPTLPFSEQDKFVLDQYIMQGGRVLWFLDMVNASLDSIKEGGSTVALINQLGLEDLLFRYGARINPVLVQDVQCNTIPVNVALAGNAPDFRPAPWLYSPLLSAPYFHPVTRNINMIRTEFAGMIDTLEARKTIRKTVLLQTSEYSRIVNAPVIISLDEVRITPRQEQFRDRYLPVAVLLEGNFESAFKNRNYNSLFPDTVIKPMETGKPSAMLVVADKDIIRNDVRPTPQGVMISPLGFDRFTQQTFGNKEFVENALHYITGHTGLISLRSRELTLRLLNKTQIKEHRAKWIVINVGVPPLIILLSGLMYALYRKTKYSP